MKNIVINKQLLTKLLATGMILTSIMSFTGCGKEAKSELRQEDNTTSYSSEEEITPNTEEVTNEAAIVDDKYRDLEGKEDIITNTNTYMFENNDRIFCDEETNEQLCMAVHGYNKLVNNNLLNEETEKELHNILIEQIVPRCVEDEEYDRLFHNLITTLEGEEGVYDTYFSLARYLHTKECANEHSFNEYGIYYCEDLEEEFYQKHETNGFQKTLTNN